MIQLHYDVVQGTIEWHGLRKGKITGSTCNSLLVGSSLSVGAKTLIYKKAAELVTGYEEDFRGNKDTERGHDLESLAIQEYEDTTFNSVERIGFVEMDDYVGYSPDGLVGKDGLVEVKCPNDPNYLRYLDDKKIKGEYYSQMQFGLFVTGRQWCDFIVFNPSYGDRPIDITRVNRDEKMIDLFRSKIELYKTELKRVLGLVEDKFVVS